MLGSVRVRGQERALRVGNEEFPEGEEEEEVAARGPRRAAGAWAEGSLALGTNSC